MKIVDIIAEKVSYKRRKVFKITYSANIYSNAVYVKIITDSEVCGIGEAVPSPFVTGETVDGVVAAIEFMKSRLIGIDPKDIKLIHEQMDNALLGNTAAKAAIDIACYDIMGKVSDQPVHKLLGAMQNEVVTDMTISIDTPENMAKDALDWVEKGFRFLKIKGGINYKEDVAAIKAIRETVGSSVELRSDFNQGYTIDFAINALNQMIEYNVAEVEQPLPAWDIFGMAELKKSSPIPIMIDEGAHTPHQVLNACKHDACDIVNIKLMKCGGIYPALQICDIAKSYGKKCMIGCMSESKLSISAGACVVAARKEIMVPPDLDAFLTFVEEQAGIQGGFQIDKDTILLSEKSGFGFDVSSVNKYIKTLSI